MVHFSAYKVTACVVTLAAGFWFASFVIKITDGEFLWNFFECLLGEPLTLKANTKQTQCWVSNDVGRKMPWEGLYFTVTVYYFLPLLFNVIDFVGYFY